MKMANALFGKEYGVDWGKRVNSICTILIIFITFGFTYFMASNSPKTGDDYLLPITNGLEYYFDTTDRNTFVLEYPAKSVSDVISIVKLFYFRWGGRVIPNSLVALSPIIGTRTLAIITGISFSLTLLLIGFLITKNMSKLLEASYICAFLFYELIYKSPMIGYHLMWTITAHYVIPTFLFLLYYLLFRRFFSEKKSIAKIMLLNVLGFIAGLTNEAIIAIFGFVFIGYLIVHIKKIWENRVEFVLSHVGLCLGTVICVFAPGNRARMQDAHDKDLLQRSYIIRMQLSIRSHEAYAFQYYKLAIIACVAIMALVIVLKKRKWIEDVFPMVLGGVSSVLIYSFASYTPCYGVFTYDVLISAAILMPCFHLISYFKEKKGIVCSWFSIIYSTVVLICFLSSNIGWMKDMLYTKQTWDERIEATTYGDIVSVPAFPDSCNNKYTRNNQINKDLSQDSQSLLREGYNRWYGRTFILE